MLPLASVDRVFVFTGFYGLVMDRDGSGRFELGKWVSRQMKEREPSPVFGVNTLEPLSA